MADGGVDPERRQARQRRLEPLALQGEQGVLGVVGGGEVRVDRLDPQVAAGRDVRDCPRQVVVSEAEPVHPGIDLEVAAERASVTRRGGFERTPRRRRRHRRRQVVAEDAVEVADAQGAEDQDRDADAGLAQDDAFLDIGAGEHRGARLLERAADFDRAVPVGVGLDDGDDAGAAGDEGGNRAQVVLEGGEVDARDGGPHHGARRLRAPGSRSACVP